MPDPENEHPNRTNQPKQRIHKIHPHRVLHADDARVALRVRLDIQVAEQSKDRDPEDEEDGVGYPREGDAGGKGNEVEEREEGGEGGCHFCEDL